MPTHNTDSDTQPSGVSIHDSTVDAQDIVGGDKISAQTFIQQQTIVNAAAPEPPRVALRVLLIAARPLNVEELPDIADAWALVDGFAQVDAPIFMRVLEPPTIEALRAALADEWDVVHFDGYGAATDEHGELVEAVLAFEREDGTVDLLKAQAFAEMLALSGHMPRLVVLSACESAKGDPSTGSGQAGLAGILLRAGVPAVLGTRESVTVQWTMTLMRPLYAQLARGKSIQQAFDAARPALRALPPHHETQTPAFDLPALVGPGRDERLCDGTLRGEMRIQHARLVGWTEPWHGKFHGDYVEPHPEPATGAAQPEGRKGYLVQTARALLRGEKLVALTGVGGIGKTALAAAAARRMAWRFPGGVFWIDGRDYLDRELPLDAVLDPFAQLFGDEFLKLPTARKRELVRRYMNDLRTPCLIVLDNADVASKEALRFVSELPPRCAALLTTRDVPESRGTHIALRVMSPHESLTFLVEEIGRRRNDPYWHLRANAAGEVELALTQDEASALQEIARLLDGHPLALLQAGALAASEGLRRALELVRAHPAQGRELNERFDFSYAPLTAAQRKLLHRLAAFATDCDEQALENLCSSTSPLAPLLQGEGKGAEGEWLPDWQGDLRALRDKSLVEMAGAYGRTPQQDEYRRYRLHPVMRDYARGKAGDAAMRAEDLRTARYFVGLADWGAQQLNNSQTALQAVQMADVERLNLLAAQQTCMAQAAWAEAISLAYRLGNLFERTGHWGDRRRALQAGVEAAKQADKKRDHAGLAHNLAVLAQATGEYAEARRLYDESLAIERALGNQAGVAQTLHQLGMLAQDTGEYAEARRLYEESLAIKRALGDQAGVARSLHQLGMLAQATGEVAEARRLYEESLAIERALGDQAGVAISLAQLSLLEEKEGNIERALELIRSAEEMFTRLGSPMREQARKHRERLEAKTKS